jgi:hypothetical protein
MTTSFIEAGVTELTFVAAAEGSSSPGFNPTVPGSAQAGDLAIFFDNADGGSPVLATPSGWTTVTSSSVGTMVARTSYKVLDSGDIGSPVVGITVGSIRRPLLAIFRPDDDIESVSVGSVNQQGSGGSPSAQVVSASGQASPLLVIGCEFNFSGTGANMASSPSFDGTITETNTSPGNKGARLGWAIENGTPVNHTISATASFDNILQSFYIRVE